MPWDEYREYPALNGSAIVHGRTSMLHLKYAWDHGRKDTDAMQFGRLVHCLLFEPTEVTERYWPWDGRRSGNAYELFKAEAEIAGAEVIRAEGEYSMEAALQAAKGFLASSRIQSLIEAGKSEQTVITEECGMPCKGRIDWISTSQHVLTDLKTTVSLDRKKFGRQFFSLGYDIKLGLYRRWLDRVTNDHWPVEVIALENKPPHDVAVIPIPDAVLDAGVDKAMDIIGRVRQAIESDYWPGMAGDEDYPLEIPFYEMEEAEMEVYQG